MIWLVIGASGFVGSALTQLLRARGETVRTIGAPRLRVSTRSTAEDLAYQARYMDCHASLSDLLSGVQTVVLAAGLASPSATWSPELAGANSLLPCVIAQAADRAGVARLVHLSSAAVQGRSRVLDESPDVRPFSPYSRSKALGEAALCRTALELVTEIVIVRATSVQGKDRLTTKNLRRIARSGLASVAGDGSAASAVSAIDDLCDFVRVVGNWPTPVPRIVLQPWGGLSTAEVLRLAGSREPRHLPSPLCATAVWMGYQTSRLLRHRLDGAVRRIESMWFGQAVDDSWARSNIGPRAPGDLKSILSGAC